MSAPERPWSEDVIGILFGKEHLFEVIPDPAADTNRQMNAIMRLAVYFGIIMLVLGRSSTAIFAVVAAGVFTYAASVKESFNEMKDKNCREPKKENIFMNPLIFDNPNEAPACDIRKPAVRRKVDDLFNDRMYREVDDIFSEHSANRQFYTVPLDRDQTAFARHLYPGVLNPLRG
jgi:hypothetical protein